jgi:homoserine O-acetyltransferase
LSKDVKTDTKFLVLSFQSDWLYPSYQSKDIAQSLRLKGVDVTYCEIKSTYGHDAFLLEVESESRLIKYFLEKISGDVSAST